MERPHAPHPRFRARRRTRRHLVWRRRAGQRVERKGRTRRLAAGQAGPQAPPHASRPAAYRQGREELQRKGADAAGREAAGSARLHGRDGGLRARNPARHPHGAERRPVRRREGNQPGAGAARAVGSAKPEINEVFATGLSQPYGIAFYPAGANPEWIYIANDDGVVRFRYKTGDTESLRRAGADRQAHPVEPSLDARHRVHAGGQAAARGRLRLERRARHVPVAAHQRRSRSLEEGQTARRRLGHRGAPRGRHVLRSGRQEREDRRDRPAQLLRSRDSSGDQSPVVRGQRARRHRRQHAVRVRDRGEGRRLLRLAVVLCRRPRRPAPEGHAART